MKIVDPSGSLCIKCMRSWDSLWIHRHKLLQDLGSQWISNLKLAFDPETQAAGTDIKQLWSFLCMYYVP